jgi:hypothetical protein
VAEFVCHLAPAFLLCAPLPIQLDLNFSVALLEQKPLCIMQFNHLARLDFDWVSKDKAKIGCNNTTPDFIDLGVVCVTKVKSLVHGLVPARMILTH